MPPAEMADECSGCWVLFVGGGPGELLNKSGCNSPSVRKAFAGEGDWLIWGRVGSLPREALKQFPELHVPMPNRAGLHLLVPVAFVRSIASFCIRGCQLRIPLYPSPQYECCDGPRGFRGAPNWVLMMPGDASLSDSCMSDRCFFRSWVVGI